MTDASVRGRRRSATRPLPRSEQVAHGYMGTSHRRDGVRSVVASTRAGLRELFSLPDDYEVLLGIGGSTSFWDAASFGLVERRSTHIVIGEFSSKFAEVTRAAPHLEDPQVCETTPGDTPILPDQGARRRLRVSAQRDLDRGDGRRAPARRRRARRRRRHFGRGRYARRSERVRRVLLRAAEVLRQRRRPLVRTVLPRGTRTHRPHPRHTLDAGHARPVDRGRELAPRADVQHARARHDLPARPATPVDARARRPRLRRAGVATSRPRPSTAGPTGTSTRRRS